MTDAIMQLDTVSLLQAMYPLPEELVLDPDTAAFVDNPTEVAPPELDMTLRVSLDAHPDRILELSISLSTEDDTVRIVPRQPAWLNRQAHDVLSSSISERDSDIIPSEYILESLEILKWAASDLLEQQALSDPSEEVEEKEVKEVKLERVWFWFPMLSTREKRKDLVDYAPRYGLTGFVLAGKPALLCLEGDGDAVGKYMSDIKSISWSDIPPFQKKVTERFRRPLSNEGEKKFSKMTDITSLIPTYGQYNHRGDMGEVRKLMEKWGVGDDFGVAVLNSGS